MRRHIILLFAALLAIGVFVAPAVANAQTTSYVTQCGSNLCVNGSYFRYGGANIYWLGLDDGAGLGLNYPTAFRVQDALQSAQDIGVTDVRCMSCDASVGSSLAIEPSAGVFNSAAFSAGDYAIEQAGLMGIRLTIPLVDYWDYYLGSIYQFISWAGGGTCPSYDVNCPSLDSYFYTNPTAISLFEQYIQEIITHVNVYTGVANNQNPTIMDWELCNECANEPASWIDTISAYINSLAPNQLVTDGSLTADLTAPDVNIVDQHYYPLNASQMKADASTVTSAGKVYVADEYQSTSASTPALSPLVSDSEISGADFWDLMPHLDTYGYEQDGDPYSLDIPVSPEFTAIRGFDYSMSGVSQPAWQAPGQPLVTNVTQSRSSVTVYWRGTTDALYYEIQAATSSSGSNTTTLCSSCGSDNPGYYTFRNVNNRDTWFRVIPFAPGWVEGTPSAWQQ